MTIWNVSVGSAPPCRSNNSTVASNQKVPLLHAHGTPIRCHSRRHMAEMPLLTDEPRVNLNVLWLHYHRLVHNVSTNKCVGNVGSCYIFALNCDIKTKWAIFELCHFRILWAISRSVLRRTSNVSGKSYNEKQNTHFMFSNFFPLEKRAVYEIMWENIVQPDRPQVTIWCIYISWLISMAKIAQSEYVILTAFTLQQWRHEGASIWRCTYSACLVSI